MVQTIVNHDNIPLQAVASIKRLQVQTISSTRQVLDCGLPLYVMTWCDIDIVECLIFSDSGHLPLLTFCIKVTTTENR
jgi:hypothetical protein